MMKITSIAGNIKADSKLRFAYQKLEKENKVERVVLSRIDAQKSRIRRTSDTGTDVAISLEHGSTLKHGDVLLIEDNKMIVVEYEPEDVLGFRIKDQLSNDQKITTAIKLGHIIGNLHRPICTKDDIVYMPIQSESEVANIKKILLPIIDCIDIRSEKIVFEQDEGAKVHAH